MLLENVWFTLSPEVDPVVVQPNDGSDGAAPLILPNDNGDGAIAIIKQ
jgi:hypothetical protein